MLGWAAAYTMSYSLFNGVKLVLISVLIGVFIGYLCHRKYNYSFFHKKPFDYYIVFITFSLVTLGFLSTQVFKDIPKWESFSISEKKLHSFTGEAGHYIVFSSERYGSFTLSTSEKTWDSFYIGDDVPLEINQSIMGAYAVSRYKKIEVKNGNDRVFIYRNHYLISLI